MCSAILKHNMSDYKESEATDWHFNSHPHYYVLIWKHVTSASDVPDIHTAPDFYSPWNWEGWKRCSTVLVWKLRSSVLYGQQWRCLKMSSNSSSFYNDTSEGDKLLFDCSIWDNSASNNQMLPVYTCTRMPSVRGWSCVLVWMGIKTLVWTEIVLVWSLRISLLRSLGHEQCCCLPKKKTMFDWLSFNFSMDVINRYEACDVWAGPCFRFVCISVDVAHELLLSYSKKNKVHRVR